MEKMKHISIAKRITSAINAVLCISFLITAVLLTKTIDVKADSSETTIHLGAQNRVNESGTSTYTFSSSTVTLAEGPSAYQLVLTITGGKADGYNIVLPAGTSYTTEGAQIANGYQMTVTLTDTSLNADAISAIVKSASFTAPSDTEGTITASLTTACALEGWTLYKNHMYRYISEQLYWDSAREACNTELAGADLVSIDDDGEQQFVFEMVAGITPAVSRIFIGLHKVDGKWEWCDEASTYSNWGTGEPSGNGNYAQMFIHYNSKLDGTYDDVASNSIRSFVAEAPASEATVSDSATYNALFKVTYNGNGNTAGTVPEDKASPYEADSTVTVLANADLAKSGYVFTGWNTKADGSGISYAANGTFAMPNADVVLYAQWKSLPSATTSTKEPKEETWCVTFLDCKGNTVSVQWVKTGDNAVAPSGFGAYTNFVNITSHRDLSPASCAVNSKWVVPNTANKE